MVDEENGGARSDVEWREALTPEQYAVLRKHRTEPPHSGMYVHVTTPGTYRCAGCGARLFKSDTKFDSGTGWPSFWDALPGAVRTRRDWGLLVPRTEVRCASCDGHLGHVFGDGPDPTGKRYCMNSVALALRREPTPSPSA